MRMDRNNKVSIRWDHIAGARRVSAARHDVLRTCIVETEGLVTRDRHTHIARKSDRLMPTDAVGEAETLHWDIAALNSAEMVRCRVPDHTGAEPFKRDERRAIDVALHQPVERQIERQSGGSAAL